MGETENKEEDLQEDTQVLHSNTSPETTLKSLVKKIHTILEDIKSCKKSSLVIFQTQLQKKKKIYNLLEECK